MSKILSKLSIIQQVDKLIELSFCLLFTGPSRLSSDHYLGYIIQLIVTTKVFLLASFWKREFLELGNDQSKPHQDKILPENAFLILANAPQRLVDFHPCKLKIYFQEPNNGALVNDLTCNALWVYTYTQFSEAIIPNFMGAVAKERKIPGLNSCGNNIKLFRKSRLKSTQRYIWPETEFKMVET